MSEQWQLYDTKFNVTWLTEKPPMQEMWDSKVKDITPLEAVYFTGPHDK